MVLTYKQQFNKKYKFPKDEPHSLAEIAKKIKAKYINKRVEELLKEEKLKATKDARSDEANTKKETEKNSHLDAKCPNCQSLILKTSIICSKCKADFSDGSLWKPIPL